MSLYLEIRGMKNGMILFLYGEHENYFMTISHDDHTESKNKVKKQVKR